MRLMRLTTLVSLSMMVAGGAASLRTLAQRQPAREANRSVSIVVDYDDVRAVSIRAGISFAELLPQLKTSGATHVTLPELSLNRLLRVGEIFQTVPREPLRARARLGHWNYFASADDRLVERVVSELQTRLPHIQAQPVRAERNVFAFEGDLPTIGDIGLGFDLDVADEIHRAGLRVVPRPVSYDWHEPALIARSIAQAAQVGDGIVAFEGDLILGHEMHLQETLAALEQHNLTFAYFAQSRHQRGDWFIAKRRMPHVIIAHQFTPAQMIPEDYHSISHRWANLARERGVRMCFVNFFRVVHATEPLECLKYLEHIRGAMEGEAFAVGDRGRQTTANDERRTTDDASHTMSNVQPPTSNLQPPVSPLASSLVPVGAGALAARELLQLNDGMTLLLAGAGTLASAAFLNRLDRARNELEQQYAPTYASKLLALGTTTLAPLAAVLLAREADNPLAVVLVDSIVCASSALTLAALTSSDEYRLRVEEYKGFDLDWFAPLLVALLAQENISRRAKSFSSVGVIAGWQLTRRLAPDPLARLDSSPAEGHTHHLSAAMRVVGDVLLRLGPRPIRKWAGLAPFALALHVAARRHHHKPLQISALAFSLIGHAALHTAFRRPERDPRIAANDTGKSWLVGSLVGLLIAFTINHPVLRGANGQPSTN